MAITAPIKTISFEDIKDEFIGKTGTEERDSYEYRVDMEVLSRMVKKIRQERHLSLEEMGKLAGVQKAQISKLETSVNSATLDTVLKVFKMLKADVHFNITFENQQLRLA